MRQGLDDDEHPVALFRSSFRGSNDFVIQISVHRYGSERVGRVSIEGFERDRLRSSAICALNFVRKFRLE